MSSTPHIKFEHSPADSLADSFVSEPGTMYPPLFGSDTMDPSEAMTPQSYQGSMFNESISDTPAPEKKPVKKRKSWGQQLPEPKTNLPPRKRAKTEDEKEQRRVERVLRNRRAAQSSRERKRQEVEALEEEKRAIERKNQDLEMRLAEMEAKNALLQSQLEQLAGGMTVFSGSSAPSPASSEHMRSAPVTFSQELFGSRDTPERPISSRPITPHPASIKTVNPASLSPEMRPVADFNASPSDMTQHPAAMLCDLQCQSEEQRPWMTSTASTSAGISQILVMTLFINMTSEAILTLLKPLSQIITSLRTSSVLSPTTSILTLIIWLTTTTASLTTSTSMNTSTTMNSLRPRFSLRIRLLRRLLACSPNLARPLSDATMVAMRSASEQQLSLDCLSSADASRREGNSPRVETLMTLLWAIAVIEKEEKESSKRRQMAPELDAASEVRQSSVELDSNLFGLRKISDKHRGRSRAFPFSTTLEHTGTGLRDQRQKSLDGWRTDV